MRISDWSSDVCSSDLRRQRPAAKGADVDANAIALLVGFRGDAVTMDDHLALIARIFQEFLADPAQIGQRLLVERHAGPDAGVDEGILADRSEEHTSELQSLMRISYAVFCLKQKQ